ncbi:alpha/beta fold hydrolase [Bosea minatitlanensis]|uniref:Alpha/beta fold hydrolase n=1 Tax=Bosea minatitlanensis TaxID=128782 RepID=A0ABW0F2S6_9HYPH|nr:alpha/beta fold hydrolase [Bosea minatitlanensis]MCT4493500.1 alpha/beta fold hydrolase [Bosea minatitlanensis]
MTVSAFHLLRPLVRAASFLAPGPAGKLAFRLFCTPPRRRVRRENAGRGAAGPGRRLAGAQAASVPFPCGSAQAYVFDPDGAGRRGTVLLVHGWSSEAAFMTAFVSPLREAGFRVVAFDLPAHGASTGRVLDMPLGVASLAAVARAFGPIHAVVSHSFGGLIALAALAGSVPGQPPVSAGRLAMIAAPSSVKRITRRFGAGIGLGRRGQAALERRIHAVAGNPVEVFDGSAQLAAIRLPTLIVHDRQDRELAFDHAEALAAAGSFARLEETQGFGHRRILQAKPVIDSVTRFVRAEAP